MSPQYYMPIKQGINMGSIPSQTSFCKKLYEKYLDDIKNMLPISLQPHPHHDTYLNPLHPGPYEHMTHT